MRFCLMKNHRAIRVEPLGAAVRTALGTELDETPFACHCSICIFFGDIFIQNIIAV